MHTKAQRIKIKGRSFLMAACCVTMASMPAQTMAQSAPPRLSGFKLFTDWAVACDNIRHCSAQSLMGEEEYRNDWLSLDIDRQAGPDGAAVLNLAYVDEWSKRFPAINSVRFVTNDGGALPFRTKPGEEGTQVWTVPLDSDAVDILRDATMLEMKASDGRTLATVSLAGLTATLRYIDDQQGRVGTTTALIARGTKSADNVPQAPVIPVVKAALHSALAAYQPTAAQWDQLRKRAGCFPDMDPEYFTPKNYRLDAMTSLLALPCSYAAYNDGTAYFTVRDSGKSSGNFAITPALFDHDLTSKEKTEEVGQLINSEYEPKEKLISHYNKGRGIGDCGDAASWVWDGEQFRLTYLAQMDECRGSNNWLRLWTAEGASTDFDKPALNL